MPPLNGTLMPFLYPCLLRNSNVHRSLILNCRRAVKKHVVLQLSQRTYQSSLSNINSSRRAAALEPDPTIFSHSSRLNPTPEDYGRTVFVDKCAITVHAGSGGNGCVAFFRDAFVPDGPPNGGDGGSGGNIWIQAIAGQTSLHKLARRGVIKAGRGVGGQGKSQGGKKGEDVCIQVPVGTVIKEIWRSDPVAEEEQRLKELRGSADLDQIDESAVSRDRWILYPGATTYETRDMQISLPRNLKPRRSHLSAMEPPVPINLDLDEPMEKPILLAAGAMGGLGNPHFASKNEPKPKYASKGELGVRIKLELELKLLADVGLVGLPNAGKSTLLRSLSNSRTRIGDWAFTTLEPTIGTVILDTNEGRPIVKSGLAGQAPRTNFTIADIPGLIEDAHLDKGLGLDFLRHIERARILAFVIDLSAGDAVVALQNLWKEVGEYELMRDSELNQQSESRLIEWTTFGSSPNASSYSRPPPLKNEDGDEMSVFPPPSTTTSSTNGLSPIAYPPISSKPWFVVATKADKPETQAVYTALRQYVGDIEQGKVPHPSGRKNAWRQSIAAIPVSAINAEGTGKVRAWTASILDSVQAVQT